MRIVTVLFIAIANIGLGAWWYLPNALHQYGLVYIALLGFWYLCVIGTMYAIENNIAERLFQPNTYHIHNRTYYWSRLCTTLALIAVIFLLSKKMNGAIWLTQSISLIIENNFQLNNLEELSQQFDIRFYDIFKQSIAIAILSCVLVFFAACMRFSIVLLYVVTLFMGLLLALSIEVFSTISLTTLIDNLRFFDFNQLYAATLSSGYFVIASSLLAIGCCWSVKKLFEQSPSPYFCAIIICVFQVVIAFIALGLEQRHWSGEDFSQIWFVFSLPLILNSQPFSGVVFSISVGVFALSYVAVLVLLFWCAQVLIQAFRNWTSAFASQMFIIMVIICLWLFLQIIVVFNFEYFVFLDIIDNIIIFASLSALMCMAISLYFVKELRYSLDFIVIGFLEPVALIVYPFVLPGIFVLLGVYGYYFLP